MLEIGEIYCDLVSHLSTLKWGASSHVQAYLNRRTNTLFLTVNICQKCDADVSVYKMSYNNCRTHSNEYTSYADVSTQGEN